MAEGGLEDIKSFRNLYGSACVAQGLNGSCKTDRMCGQPARSLDSDVRANAVETGLDKSHSNSHT